MSRERLVGEASLTDVAIALSLAAERGHGQLPETS